MTEMMKQEPTIRVGVYTDGVPELTREGDVTILHNQLIGKGYHWQKRIESRLPGKVILPGSGDGWSADGIGLINELPPETYLRCVTGSEMNPQAPVEFLKAHAVIARSWLFHKLSAATAGGCHGQGRVDTPNMLVDWDDTTTHCGFDVCSDDHCQRYQGLQDVPSSLVASLEQTRGMVLTDAEGRVADARYSKCCGGRTEDYSACWGNESPSYLRSHADEYCDLSEMPDPLRRHFFETVLKDYDRNEEPFGEWSAVISKQAVADNLHDKLGRDVGSVRGVRILERGMSGRAFMALVEGSESNLIVGKELLIRRLLAPTHLYSSLIELEDLGDDIRITGRGWGHGVGLCQIGAAHMALKGASCSEILDYYYPGTRLVQLYR